MPPRGRKPGGEIGRNLPSSATNAVSRTAVSAADIARMASSTATTSHSQIMKLHTTPRTVTTRRSERERLSTLSKVTALSTEEQDSDDPDLSKNLLDEDVT